MGVAHQPFGIGIEQQLVMIEAVAAFGLVGAGNPVAIDLTGHHFRQVDMPDIVGDFRQRDALELAAA